MTMSNQRQKVSIDDTLARLQKKLSIAHGGLWLLCYNKTQYQLSISPELLQKLGYLGQELAYTWKDFWGSVVHPEDISAATALIQQATKPAMFNTILIEFRMWDKKNGGWQWVSLSGSNDTHDAQSMQGEASGIIHFTQTRSVNTSSLPQPTKSIGSLLAPGNSGTWDWNFSTNNIVFSDNYFNMLGYSPQEVKHSLTTWEYLIHPKDRQHVKQTMEEHISGFVPYYECKLRMLHKNGNYIWFMNLGQVTQRDSTGIAVRMVTTLVNIDNQQEQETPSVVLQTERYKSFNAQHAEIAAAITDHIIATLHSTSYHNRQARRILQELKTLKNEPDNQNFLHALTNAVVFLSKTTVWFRTILEALPFPVFITDTEKNWIYLNKEALAAVSSGNSSDILSQSYPQWIASLFPQPGQAGTTDISNLEEFYHPHLNRYFRQQHTTLLDNGGNIAGYIEILQDTTAMHTDEDHMHILLARSPFPCTLWKDGTTCLDCNQAAMDLFGITNKQEALQNYSRFSPPLQPSGEPSLEVLQKYISATLETGFQRFEYEHQKRNGTPLPTEKTLVRLNRPSGNIVIVYTRDLTELRMKEAEIDKERRLLRKVMDSSPVCFFILVDNLIRFATPHAMLFLGIDIGSHITDFYTNETERVHFFTELRTTGAVNWRVVSLVAADGSTKEMLANAFLTDYYGEPCVMAWLLDVTGMREKERELRLARDMAEQSMHSKSDFLANMSHEIRTPMNAILGMIHLVLGTELTELQRNYLEKAKFSTKALLRIINDILDFSKIEAGKLEMETVRFPLSEVLQGVIDLLQESATHKGIELKLTVDPLTPVFLLGDPLRLTQVIINLTSNAIKFTDSGSVSIDVKPLAITDEHIILQLSIKDTGIGIAKEQLGNLFNAFSQADTSTTRRYGGTGLGLAISKQLINLMDGTISCSSELNKGTIFTFTARFGAIVEQKNPLPIELTDNSALAQQPEELVSHLKGTRILVAEDNEINQMIAQETLEQAGLVVDIASNGKEAIQMALKNDYALIFMDIQMPEVDGLTATRELRKHEKVKNTPIIAMTAHAMSGDKEKSLAAGMNEHIAKPFDTLEVFTIIAKWVNEPYAAQETAKIDTASVHISSSAPRGNPFANPGARNFTSKSQIIRDSSDPLSPHIIKSVVQMVEDISTALMSGNTQEAYAHTTALLAILPEKETPDLTVAVYNMEQAIKNDDYPLMLKHLLILEKSAMQVGKALHPPVNTAQ